MTHHIYNQYVEEKGKDRIVWFDEGIAMNVSNDHDYLNDDEKFKEFLQKNILGVSKYPVLNKLKHGTDFINEYYNAYDFSYLVVRYLIENYSHKDFLELSKHKDKILKVGEDVLSKAIDYYCDKYKLNKN